MIALRSFAPRAIAFALASVFFVVSAQAQGSQKPEIVSPLGVKHFANADEKGEIAAAEQKLAADP
ncbi:MAG: hypothetical protein ACRD82_12515, partial [Blastocatellia bacterium]